jgi:hypothetical protein
MRLQRIRLVPLVGVVLSMVFALLTTGASAAPTSFSLTFEGAHATDPNFSSGLRHEGRFTASAPFCPSGRAYDADQINDGVTLTAFRLHECDDGSGSFTAFMPNARGEHGGSGTWKIVDGTGRYAQLRGQGTYIGTRLGGDPDDFSTITYRTQWQGVVDFDADPPVIQSLGASARKLPTRVRRYTLRVALSARDASPMSYAVVVRAGGASLDSKNGSTTSGQAAVTYRIQPPRGARSVSVSVAVTDVLGNGPTTASRMIKLAK